MSEDVQGMQEVQPLREVPRPPECCGAPMRKLQGQAAAGGLATVWVCAKDCGRQVKGETVR